jgi:hypothetical protein
MNLRKIRVCNSRHAFVIEDSRYSLRDTSKRVRYEARDEEPSYMVCVDGQMVVVVVVGRSPRRRKRRSRSSEAGQRVNGLVHVMPSSAITSAHISLNHRYVLRGIHTSHLTKKLAI